MAAAVGESAKDALCGGGDMHAMHSVLCVVLVRSFTPGAGGDEEEGVT